VLRAVRGDPPTLRIPFVGFVDGPIGIGLIPVKVEKTRKPIDPGRPTASW
jgi:hypothetical protein